MADGSVLIDTALDVSGLKSDLANMAGLITKGITTAIATASAALAAFGGYAISVGSQFETGMAKVSTLCDTSTQDVGALGDALLDLSNKTGISNATLSEAAYQALSAGVAFNDLSTYLDTASKLSVAGFTSVDTAVDGLSSVVNAYGSDVINADTAAKILIQTQNKGKTTVDELSASLAQCTPTAAAMGVSFENVGAALSVMTAKGTPTAQATTQLNSLFAELGKQGTTAQKALTKAAEGTKYAGMSFTEMMESGASLNDVIQLMSGSLDKNAQAVASQMGKINDATGSSYTFEEACDSLGLSTSDVEGSLLDMFSSIEAGKAALSIASGEGEQFNACLEAMGTDADVVGEAYDKMTDTFDHKLSVLKSNAANFATVVYSGMEEPLKKLAETGTGYLEELTTAFNEGGFEGLSSAIGNVLSEAITYIVDYIPSIVDGAVSLVQGFVSGIIDNLPTVVNAAMQIGMSLLNAIFDIAPQIIQGFADLLMQLGEGIVANAPQLIESFNTCLNTILDTVVTMLPQLLDIGIQIISAIVKGLLSNISSVVSAIGQLVIGIAQAIIQNLPLIISSVIEIVTAVVTAILDNLPLFLDGLIQLIDALVEELPAIIEILIEALTTIITALVEALPELLPVILEGIISIVTALLEVLPDIIQMIVEVLPTLIESIISALLECLPQIIEAGITLFTALVNDLPTIINAIVSALPTIIDSILKALQSALPQLIQAGIQLFVALVQALPQINSSIVAVLPDIINSILTAIIELLPLIVDAGIQLFISLVQALPQIIASIVAVLPDIINSIISTIIDNLPLIIQAGITLFLALIENLPEIIAGIVAALPEIISAIIEAFMGALGDMADVGWNLLNGLLDGIIEAASGVLSGIMDVCDDIWNGICDFFGIASPSKLMRDTVGKFIPLGMAVGIEQEADSVTNAVDKIAEDVSNTPVEYDVTSNVDDLDFDDIYRNAYYGVEQENADMGNAHFATTAKTYTDENTKNDDNEPENPTQVHTTIVINDREFAKAVTPAISEELDWEGK